MHSNPSRCLLTALLCVGLCSPLVAKDAAQTVGQKREGVLFWTQAQREARFPQMYKLFPADRVAHGAHVYALPQGDPLAPVWKDESTTLASYMHKHHIAGVMVLQHGRIRVQRYAANFGPQDRWTSFSVAKSFTSTLLGIALQQGYVHSLDNHLVTYIPQLRGSAYADVTVRQLLTMTSGVRWDESYTDPKSDVAQMYQSVCHDGQPHVLPYLEKLPRQWPAGSHWNYNTAETDLLGLLVQRATYRSLATYLSQTIWKPYGMSSDAYWLKDECDGSDTGGSGLSATLADYARMGQFMLGGGRIDGKPIIGKAWMQGAMQRQEQVDAPGRGYGYLWWADDDDSYAAIGIFGQLIYVDPSRDLVIAQVAAWPHADTDALVAARRAFVAAVKRGADNDQPARPATATSKILPRYHWRLSQAIDSKGQRIDALFARKNKPLQLDFANDHLHVSNACNVMNGSYKIQDGKLEVGAMRHTMMACFKPTVNALDGAISKRLRDHPQIDVNTAGNTPQLRLISGAGDTLVFDGKPSGGSRSNATTAPQERRERRSRPDGRRAGRP